MDNRLTQLQWQYLTSKIQASELDYYRSQKIALKGKFVDSPKDVEAIGKQLNLWQLKEIVHGDIDTKPYRCDCGKPIRHLYVVHHQIKDIEIHLGSTCYKKYVGIDVDKVEKVLVHKEVLVEEHEEIIAKYDAGYIVNQLFLLDYESLDPDFRQQLSLGLPLSDKQEIKAYKDLNLEDEGTILTLRGTIRKMTGLQKEKLNHLTSEARRTVIARLASGRILGVLDEVLEAAPDLIADRDSNRSHGESRLETRLTNMLRHSDASLMASKVIAHRDDISQLINMVDCGVIEEVSLVRVAKEMLTEQQREFWAGHTSGRQKREIARHLLLGKHIVEPSTVDNFRSLNKQIQQLITLKMPLTETQMHQVKLK